MRISVRSNLTTASSAKIECRIYRPLKNSLYCVFTITTCFDLRGHHHVGFYAGYESGTSMLTKIFKIPKNTHIEYCQALRVTIHGIWNGHRI